MKQVQTDRQIQKIDSQILKRQISMDDDKLVGRQVVGRYTDRSIHQKINREVRWIDIEDRTYKSIQKRGEQRERQEREADRYGREGDEDILRIRILYIFQIQEGRRLIILRLWDDAVSGTSFNTSSPTKSLMTLCEFTRF